jgi:phage terminase Nu1 subunit (DNA packaging protein)
MTDGKADDTPALLPIDIDASLVDLMRRHTLPDGVQDADMNQSEMAAALNTSVNTIAKWIASEKMPVVQVGGNGKSYVLRLSHCWAWKSARDSEDSNRRSHNADQISALQADFLGLDIDNPMASLSAKERAALAQADIAHSKAMHMRRQLLQMDDVVDLLESIFKMVREKMDAMPDVLERELSLKPEEVDKVQRIGAGVLTGLAEKIKEAELTGRDVADVEVQPQWMV